MNILENVSYSVWKQVAQNNSFTVYAQDDGGTDSKVAWCGTTDVVFKVYVDGDNISDFNTNFLSPTSVASEDDAIANIVGLNGPKIIAETRVQEEYGSQQTGGNFAAKSFTYTIPSGSEGDWTVHDRSFPIPVALFAAQMTGNDACGGDEMEFQIAPDTVVGAIAAAVAVDDDVITVTDTAYANLQVGRYFKLDDGTNEDDLGMVLEKQADNKIKVENAASFAFAPTTPTYVKMTVKMVPHGHLPSTSRLVIGDSKIGGTYMDANITMRLRYKNNSGTAKSFEFWLEYMY